MHATTNHEFKADNDTGQDYNGIVIKYQLVIMQKRPNDPEQGVELHREEATENFNIANGAEYTHTDLRDRDPGGQDDWLTESVDMVDGVSYWVKAYTNLQLRPNNDLISEDETHRVND